MSGFAGDDPKGLASLGYSPVPFYQRVAVARGYELFGEEMDTIPIIFQDTTEIEPGTLRGFSPGFIIKNIDTDKMRESFSRLSEQISGMLQDIKNVGDFKLKEVQLSVEITAEGGVALIGNVKAGAKGAVTLTFSI